ncbi:CHAP domain-containing protein [Lentzea sp. NPDC051208]|uniref:CHAP domain-containing protein n=1 Tax=Lentzea sp. NPDC051208 TaxID=3154642 RepID=UPI003419DE1B
MTKAVALSLLAATFSILTSTISPVAVAGASDTTSVQMTETQVRAEIAAVTRWQLENPRPYKTNCTSGGTIYQSVPSLPWYNYLGRNDSNANCNICNGYNGQEWCGHFARFVWDKGGAYDVAQKPSNYASSQAWRTGVGNRFHAYSTSILPKQGDVLVWSNNSDSSRGHVAVVVAVNTTNRAITYIGGNEGVNGNSDSIVLHSDYWTNMDVSMSGKTFRGFASRF